MKPRRAKALDRLVDAEPCFYDYAPDRALNPNASPDRHGIGVMFACPIHDDCWLGVQFSNPLDGGAPFEPKRPSWQRTGDTFEALTLSPSIRVLGGADGCEWHGFIHAGRFQHCGDAK